MTWVLIGGAVVVIWLYSKYAAAKTQQLQKPQLTVPQGGIAQSVLSALGVATNLVPGASSASQAVETAQYAQAAGTPGTYTLSQIESGQDAGATSAQLAQANASAQLMNASMGLEPDPSMFVSTGSLSPQSDSDDMGDLTAG
jgi:hypothetical protein